MLRSPASLIADWTCIPPFSQRSRWVRWAGTRSKQLEFSAWSGSASFTTISEQTLSGITVSSLLQAHCFPCSQPGGTFWFSVWTEFLFPSAQMSSSHSLNSRSEAKGDWSPRTQSSLHQVSTSARTCVLASGRAGSGSDCSCYWTSK